METIVESRMSQLLELSMRLAIGFSATAAMLASPINAFAESSSPSPVITESAVPTPAASESPSSEPSASAFASLSPSPKPTSFPSPSASPTMGEVVGIDDPGLLPVAAASKPPVVGVNDPGLAPIHKPTTRPNIEPTLPRTGAPLFPITAGGLLLVGTGVVMIRVGKKRPT